MASVFLSYDHEDAALAAPIASALEKAGHSVWWDPQIHGGAEYNSAIESAVERAEVVVVLWSERSVKSAWVRDEAAEGRDRGRLVPVALDGTKPPMGFRQYQTIRLSNRKGRKAQEIEQLLHAVETLAGSAPAATVPSRKPRRVPFGWLAAAVGVVLLLGLGLLFWKPFASRPSAAVIAVSPGDASSASRDYARDLLAQLGELQSARPDALQLVGANERSRAGLVFEVAGTNDGKQARASLVLVDGKSGSLLWSNTFERPAQESSDLRQQLSYTAARLVDCTVEAHPGGRPVLKPDGLKLYLNGCAKLATGGDSSADLVRVFRRVIAAAPRFEGAWAKLLLAEDDAWVNQSSYFEPDLRLARELKRDIAAARKINPDMGEAFLAESDLLPLNAFGQKLALADRAVASEPDSAVPLSFRYGALLSVGRITNAVDDARRAVELDPISLTTRMNYVLALAQSGRTEAALDEIAKAERIWPGSSVIAGARFAVHFRFGDPRVAWQMIQAGQTDAGWIRAESFIRARLTHKREDIDRAIKDALAEYAHDRWAFSHLVQAMTILDRDEELLPVLMSAPIQDATYVTDVTFRPAAREFWRNPNSLRYAKRVGLIDYWQSSGHWPDFCNDPQLPYDCKKEAAKLQ